MTNWSPSGFLRDQAGVPYPAGGKSVRAHRSASPRIFRDIGVWLATAAFAVLFAAPALAQQQLPSEEIEVAKRPRPEFDPLGIHLGGFFLYPSLAVSEAYNDNIFATERNEKDDFITVISPTARVQSTWSNHELHADAGAHVGRYISHDDEDYKDLFGDIGGRLDITRDSKVFLDGGYAHLHEDRSSPDDAGGTKPTTYDKAQLNGAFSQQFNRFLGRLELRSDHLAYNDVPSTTGTIRNGDRDRFDYEEAVRLSYEFIDNYHAFLRGALRQARYDDDVDRNGFDRNSNGYKLDAGISVDLTGLLSVEAHLGYLSVDFSDSRLQTVDGLSAGLLGTWNVTRLTTIKADIDRDVQPTTLNGAAAELDTGGFLSVDHELLRNLILSGRLGYTRSEFTGIARNDDIYDAGLSAKYLIGRGLAVVGSYNFDKRDSNVNGASYDRNLVMLRVSYGL